ncbi:uncharacterized protein CIMG_13477 [Coccidioides immitis RS]|uniref:Uncharacterized protein n=1 Tax=Coccidioides immitis (strain RS) TaxID=246410 RepID=A0A0D8JV75_COCIM|nr:uncharacterized protein CIMG_13477 [Coccidioides immitis RS]KJF61197.1 hypothetical protein CIMG_13477 [Coccidioides immitis RS]
MTVKRKKFLRSAVKSRYSPDLKATAGQRLYQEISGSFVPIWTGRGFYSQDLKQFRGMFLQDERIAPTMNALRDGSDIRRIRELPWYLAKCIQKMKNMVG